MCHTVPHEECRQVGCSSPFLRPWVRRWINLWSLWVCDAWPVQRQTYGYLSSRRASPPFDRYQIVLFCDRGTRVWTTCVKSRDRESNPPPSESKSNVLTRPHRRFDCVVSELICWQPNCCQWHYGNHEISLCLLYWHLNLSETFLQKSRVHKLTSGDYAAGLLYTERSMLISLFRTT